MVTLMDPVGTTTELLFTKRLQAVVHGKALASLFAPASSAKTHNNADFQPGASERNGDSVATKVAHNKVLKNTRDNDQQLGALNLFLKLK